MTHGSLACPPRFGTPRSDRETLGPQVAEVARRLALPLLPWQQYVVDVALELRADGSFAYDEVDLTVPRQSGKTTLVKAKTIHRLVALARTHGPQRSMYTAQTRLAARKKLEQDFAESLRRSRSFHEVPHARARPKKPTEWRLSLNNGLEHIQFGTGSYWQIDAPSRTGAHGDTLDDATVDEAFAHEDDAVEGAVRPAQATRRDAQIWVLSTAGDGKSKYLWRKVLGGRAATETGEHGRVAYFEWSAPDDADPSDPAVWASCSPSMGLTISPEFLASEWDRACRKGQEGVDTFRRAYLNQWPEIPVLDDENRQRVFTAGEWGDCADEDSAIAGSVCFAFDVSPDRAWATICSAGRRADGLPHVEVVEHRQGTGWVAGRLSELVDRWKPPMVAVDPAGPAGGLLADLKVQVELVGTREATQACGLFYDDVVENRLRHLGQPELSSAVADAEKRPVGDAWLWSRKNSVGVISPLVAATLARWASSQAKEASDILF